jgi:hypothetical protein
MTDLGRHVRPRVKDWRVPVSLLNINCTMLQRSNLDEHETHRTLGYSPVYRLLQEDTISIPKKMKTDLEVLLTESA